MSRRMVIHESLDDILDTSGRPDWYDEAVTYLRGGADNGNYGYYLYHLISSDPSISTVVNIGTARGHSTVCCARAIAERGSEGVVHTIDIIPPDEPRNWHASHQSEEDPAIGSKFTIRDFVSRFHDPGHDNVPIEFHTGNSNDVLDNIDVSDVDLVFHDGRHNYTHVKNDILYSSRDRESPPIQIFDDCYLHSKCEVFRPLDIDALYTLDHVPLLRDWIEGVRSYAVTSENFPGVNRAVQEAYDSGRWPLLSVVRDRNHAPITTLFPNAESPLSTSESE